MVLSALSTLHRAHIPRTLLWWQHSEFRRIGCIAFLEIIRHNEQSSTPTVDCTYIMQHHEEATGRRRHKSTGRRLVQSTGRRPVQSTGRRLVQSTIRGFVWDLRTLLPQKFNRCRLNFKPLCSHLEFDNTTIRAVSGLYRRLSKSSFLWKRIGIPVP